MFLKNSKNYQTLVNVHSLTKLLFLNSNLTFHNLNDKASFKVGNINVSIVSPWLGVWVKMFLSWKSGLKLAKHPHVNLTWRSIFDNLNHTSYFIVASLNIWKLKEKPSRP